MKQFIIDICYKLISLLDYIYYHYIRKEQLIDDCKTIEEYKVNGLEILTDTGYKELSAVMTTKPFDIYTITLENGYSLDCADNHILFDKDYNEVFVKELSVGDYVITDVGSKKIVSINKSDTKISMCDATVNDENHRFYSNGILSHNSTTTAIYCLWVILFNTDKAGLILSKSGPAGQDLLAKIKDMYRYLPYHLKCGTMKWNQTSISFDNNSSISTEAFSPTAGLGKTINFLILDEFAWCPPNDVELFYNNIIPTVTTISDSNVCIMSTQNGFNLFYKLWKAAVEHRNIYAPFKVDWDQVPQFNPETKQWEKRTEEWKKMMIGILGSEEAFYYQYGTMFAASNDCLVSRECLANIREKTVLFKHRDDCPVALVHDEALVWDPNFDFNELKTGWFVILADLAEGGGGDADSTIFNIVQIIGKDKFRQVGYWKANNVDLENAALDFWLMCVQLFNNDRCMYSVEWNTYGALFYQYVLNLNEPEYRPDFSIRFNYASEGLDTTYFVQYKKGSDEETIPGFSGRHTSKQIPGIRWTADKKRTGCALLKMELERNNIELYDLVTVGELENFEDKNGNGSYRASYGHDDLIMTFVQLPMLKQTAKYKDIMEEYEAANAASNAPGYMNNFDYSALQTNMVVTQTPIFNNNPFGSLYPNNPMSSLYPNR